MVDEKNIDELIKERVVEELTAIDQEEVFDDMLDECYGMVNVAGYEYVTSRLLKEIDPTAYRCGMNDYIDSLELEEINGDYYDTDQVGEIRGEIEEELDQEEEE